MPTTRSLTAPTVSSADFAEIARWGVSAAKRGFTVATDHDDDGIESVVAHSEDGEPFISVRGPLADLHDLVPMIDGGGDAVVVAMPGGTWRLSHIDGRKGGGVFISLHHALEAFCRTVPLARVSPAQARAA
jgi:hypothetical protein